MEFILFTFNIRGGFYLIELCSIRNEDYSTALFGFSYIKGFDPINEREVTCMNLDILFSSFLFSQLGKIFKRSNK